jgi:hypothetical protein
MAAADAAAEECAICFEAPQPGAEVYTLPCGHGYCHACVREWWAQPGPNMCPTCRKCFAGLRGCMVTTVPAAPVMAAQPRPRVAAAATAILSSDLIAAPAATAEAAELAAGRKVARCHLNGGGICDLDSRHAAFAEGTNLPATAPPTASAQVAEPARGDCKRREPSLGTDPEPWTDADVQPRPAKWAARAAVHHGGSTPSTSGVGVGGRSPGAQVLHLGG